VSFEADLITYVLGQTSVTNIIGTRFYPNVNMDESVTFPYTCVSFYKDRQATLRGPNATVKAKVVFDTFSHDYLDTVNVTAALVNVLHGYVGTMGTTKLLGAVISTEADKPVPPADNSNDWIYHREAEAEIVFSESPALQQ
jgi:hypothetical protein